MSAADSDSDSGVGENFFDAQEDLEGEDSAPPSIRSLRSSSQRRTSSLRRSVTPTPNEDVIANLVESAGVTENRWPQVVEEPPVTSPVPEVCRWPVFDSCVAENSY